MAVAWDATAAGSGHTGAPNGSLSWTHTASGSNRCGIVGIAVGAGGFGSFTGYTRSATWGGVSMTSLGAINSNNGTAGFVELFYLLNPATGAQTVAVTTSQNQGSILGDSASYTGVGSVGTAVTSFGTANPSVVVSSAAGRRVVAAHCAGVAISAPTQTQLYLNNFDGNSAGGNLLIQDAAGAGSVTLGATAADWCGSVGVDLLAAAGSTKDFFAMM